LSTDRSEKVATPFTAATVVVPDSVPEPAFVPKATVMLSVAEVTVLPLPSWIVTSTAGATAAPATAFDGCTEKTSFVAVPGANSTVAVSVIATVFSVPVTVAVPAVVDDVNVAEYVPSRLSVTAPSVPASVTSATVSPPAVRLLPFASFNCTVTVDVDVPSATMLAGDAVIVDVAADAAPGVMLNALESALVTVIAVPVAVSW
jgi:hypothetical protein